MSGQVEKISSSLSNVNDNVELRQLEGKIEKHQRKLADLKDSLGNLPERSDAERELRKLEAQQAVHQTQLDRDSGRLEKIEESIKNAKKELEQKKYAGIDEKHKLKRIELHAQRSAIQDLEKYHCALDKALMRYHEMKMEEINKTVKEYWQTTYRGNDIDYIEIRADAESATSRRSHN